MRGWSVFQLYVRRLYIGLIAYIIIKGENSEKINFCRIFKKKVMLFIDLYIDRYVDKMLRSSWKLAKHTIHQLINKTKNKPISSMEMSIKTDYICEHLKM